jgi:WD40 repeat protein
VLDLDTNNIILNPNNGYSVHKNLSHSVFCVYSLINLTSGKFTACGFETIHIWDSNYEILKVIQAHIGWVTCLLFTNNLLISGSSDKTIKVL